ncbi:MAG TPA: HAD family phosphatase [Pirellulales bacterium]|jgi:putative hydrolase of the HAD superfamily
MPPAFIYFDLGNVICHFSREKEVSQVAAVSGLPEVKVKEVLLGENGLLWQYEAGQLDDDGFRKAFCAATGSHVATADLLKANAEIFTLNGSLVPLIGHLEDSQIPLGILSNTSPSHWKYLTDGRYAILPGAFRKFVLSYQVGVIKPDEKIFRVAIETAGVPAEQIFYTDDLPEHIAAAKRLGMDAVLYTTTDALAAELRTRGVRCNF